MKAYLIRRLMILPVTLFGISVLCFAMLQLAPGSPVSLRLMKMQGQMSSEMLTDQLIEQTKEMYGLDKPVWQQYLSWAGRMLMLEFGESFKDRRPVLDKITEALPYTLQLNIISIFLVYLISVPIGIYSATHNESFSDRIITLMLFVLYSLPSFWVAMLLLYFLAGGRFLDWFPVYGLSSTEAETWPWARWLWDRIWHLVLPVTCLTYNGLAAVSRYARSDMIEVINADYIRTARAYGFTERTVVFKYALRNSLITLITLFGTILPALIGGAVIIEQIFSIPGMGRLLFEAILSRDYPLVMGILTISAILTLLGLILQDIVYAIADPRIKFE